MVKARQIETDQGIQGEDLVRLYDRMQWHPRDKGWMETEALVAAGITAGRAAELGPGPGYLGLEWLKKTVATTLTGIDISPDMAAPAAMAAARQFSNHGWRTAASSMAECVINNATRRPWQFLFRNSATGGAGWNPSIGIPTKTRSQSANGGHCSAAAHVMGLGNAAAMASATLWVLPVREK